MLKPATARTLLPSPPPTTNEGRGKEKNKEKIRNMEK
jgi:hypothetical protein